METASWVSAIAACVSAGGAIAAVLVAYFQLSKLNDTIKISTLSVVLALESEMGARKQKVTEHASFLNEERQNGASEEFLQTLREELEGYVEDWINATERFAFCILKGHFSEDDWKDEYAMYFSTLVENHSQHFGKESHFTNILELHHRWKQQHYQLKRN